MRHSAPPLLVAAACAALAATPEGGAAQAPGCAFRGAPSALAERPSPLDSVLVRLGDGEAKLCYGRPAADGAMRVGGELPYGSPWQMGANEPTTLHLPFPATVGTVGLGPGSYSLYAIPEAGSWTIVVNGNPDRWGVPIGPEVRAADIGSFRAATTLLPEPVERLTFRFEPSGPGAGSLVYEWERIGLSIPLARR
ncbi:MAG TPA: DUF2911 domain-containing protein [Longimicrobiales bacterium]|nr:DUF2911 domain-containing protein [Longimicrobiales bacterium]